MTKQPVIATGSSSMEVIKYSKSSLGKSIETYKEECGGSSGNQTRREAASKGPLASDRSDNSSGGVQTDSSDLDSSEAEADRTDNEVLLHAHLTTVAPPVQTTNVDKYFWTVDGSQLNKFSAARTLENCRPRENPKDWSKLIWFSGCVPKHAFNMWIAQLDRMPVRSRLER
ncbi:hypothetical protein DY000_02011884 [Brassica cretica]|uniref:Reverse transcriptase zinc-binding domain-containing protein n=1 Tax=Brassica cretica TaxID=69181 RepID=A0ABQ7D6G2_BRACR|nr:hypothetical protein DY000_02011884 [Brassica cretica]